jgi:hypothetical protein
MRTNAMRLIGKSKQRERARRREQQRMSPEQLEEMATGILYALYDCTEDDKERVAKELWPQVERITSAAPVSPGVIYTRACALMYLGKFAEGLQVLNRA